MPATVTDVGEFGVWAVTTPPSDSVGELDTQETELDPTAQDQLRQWSLSFRLKVTLSITGVGVFLISDHAFAVYPTVSPNLSHLDSLSKGF